MFHLQPSVLEVKNESNMHKVPKGKCPLVEVYSIYCFSYILEIWIYVKFLLENSDVCILEEF